MYCIKCGKRVNGVGDVCDECKAAMTNPSANSLGSAESENINVTMLSFGKALASILMGFGVFIVSSVLNSAGARMNFIAMIFMAIIDVAAIVLAIFFGAKAIQKYGSFKATAGKKPTPAFILGIIGVVLAGIAAVIVVVFLFVELPAIV